jgi:two-component system, LytTR family, response regulator
LRTYQWMWDLEEMLPAEKFFRIHHSTIINANAVVQYSRSDGGFVGMLNCEKLVVYKPRKKALLNRLGLKA